MAMTARELLLGICISAVAATVACKKSQPEIGTVPGAGKINARSLITQADTESLMGPGAKKVFHPGWNECYVIQASTPDSDTVRPSAAHAFVALRVYTRERWETDKNPHGNSDRTVDGIGDEAICRVCSRSN
jgi:hypothetical protein